MAALAWYDTDLGPTPDCADCLDRLADPAMIPAIHSIAISRRRDVAVIARQYIDEWHNRGHR